MPNFLQKLFKRHSRNDSPSPPRTACEAIEYVDEIIDATRKRCTSFESKIAVCSERIKRFKKTNEKHALAELKEKKRLEKRLEQTNGILATLEFQRDAIQDAKSVSHIMDVIEAGVQALKRLHEYAGTEKFYDIIEELSEQCGISDEIADIITNPAGCVNDELNDEDLLKELESMRALSSSDSSDSESKDERPSCLTNNNKRNNDENGEQKKNSDDKLKSS